MKSVAAIALLGLTGLAGAPGGVAVNRVGAQHVGTREIFSSTSMAVSWAAPSGGVHHYTITAVEGVQGTSVSASVAASSTSATLTGLKAATTYAITVTACEDEACVRSSAAPAVEGSTDTEYWQLQGGGSSITGLTKIVSDGNARLSVTRFGAEAGDMAGRIQLYYGPMGSGRASPLAAAVASQAADAAQPSTYLSFSSRAGSSGLNSPATSSTWIRSVATGQGVPLTREAGGLVRLFFEAAGADGKTRIFWIDSRDGYYGLDFNAGSPGVCSTAEDYSTGGDCAPTLAIGVEGDATGANARITNARQFKVAWPILDRTHWDAAPGTFMVFTTDRVSGCSDAPMNHGYAVWSGSAWQVQYRDDGCPKLFTSAQAAFPLHVGGARYKLYYGDPSIADGRRTGNLPFLGPKKLIYGDGQVTSDADRVDFEDWEAQSSARDVVFVWPNGDVLDAAAEGYIDDYHFLSPTGSLDLQVMYVTITDGAVVPFAAAAVLKNP